MNTLLQNPTLTPVQRQFVAVHAKKPRKYPATGTLVVLSMATCGAGLAANAIRPGCIPRPAMNLVSFLLAAWTIVEVGLAFFLFLAAVGQTYAVSEIKKLELADRQERAWKTALGSIDEFDRGPFASFVTYTCRAINAAFIASVVLSGHSILAAVMLVCWGTQYLCNEVFRGATINAVKLIESLPPTEMRIAA